MLEGGGKRADAVTRGGGLEPKDLGPMLVGLATRANR